MELGETTVYTSVLSVQILKVTKHLFVKKHLKISEQLTTITISYSGISYHNPLLIEIIACNNCFPIIFNE